MPSGGGGGQQAAIANLAYGAGGSQTISRLEFGRERTFIRGLYWSVEGDSQNGHALAELGIDHRPVSKPSDTMVFLKQRSLREAGFEWRIRKGKARLAPGFLLGVLDKQHVESQ